MTRITEKAGTDLVELNKKRLGNLVSKTKDVFNKAEEPTVFSTPGRTELGGNHTDHQSGKVLAGAVSLDMLAAAYKTDNGLISVKSGTRPILKVNSRHLSPLRREAGKTSALIRGVASGISQMGYDIGGFSACFISDIPRGSGLSSSAAFEIMTAMIINHLYCNNELSILDIAKISQQAENNFFGKPCGLMDQIACAYGGVIKIDFKNSTAPEIFKMNFDIESFGYSLFIIDVKASHRGLNSQYADLAGDMKKVSDFFNKSFLREVDEEDFYGNINELRAYAGERAILRSMHFFEENKRVDLEENAVRNSNFNDFLRLVNESGLSSELYLQNITPPGSGSSQPMALALAICRKLLKNLGAVRVHGGGFGGTIQAYVPIDQKKELREKIESYLGENTCTEVYIRNEGCMVLN